MKYIPTIFLWGSFLLFSNCSDMGTNPQSTDCPTVDECGVCDGDGSTCNIAFSQIQSIFDIHCISCHGSQGGLNLSSYAQVMSGGNSGAVVIARDHLASLLWQKINDGTMPPSGEGLSESEISTIATWIDEGASSE
ncbi:MAG: c-type cytochrome domain-containing protein [Candidatus Marinimicrobia bacterium]|nr:c-type cytochrome domain-containing protein [Candidatus Neomarinimicrobiota bacterium]